MSLRGRHLRHEGGANGRVVPNPGEEFALLQMRTPGSSAGYGRLRPFAGTVVPKLHGAVVEVFLGQAGRDCGRGSRRWALLVTCFAAACFAMAACLAAACFAMAACFVIAAWVTASEMAFLTVDLSTHALSSRGLESALWHGLASAGVELTAVRPSVVTVAQAREESAVREHGLPPLRPVGNVASGHRHPSGFASRQCDSQHMCALSGTSGRHLAPKPSAVSYEPHTVEVITSVQRHAGGRSRWRSGMRDVLYFLEIMLRMMISAPSMRMTFIGIAQSDRPLGPTDL